MYLWQLNANPLWCPCTLLGMLSCPKAWDTNTNIPPISSERSHDAWESSVETFKMVGCSYTHINGRPKVWEWCAYSSYAPIYTLMADQKNVVDVHTRATWEKRKLASIQCSNNHGTCVWVVMWLDVDLKKQTSKLHMFQRDWTTCSKYANHPGFNSLYDLGGRGLAISSHSMNTRIFTLIMNRTFIWAPKTIKRMTMIWIC
jgi:hypothetical protein